MMIEQFGTNIRQDNLIAFKTFAESPLAKSFSRCHAETKPFSPYFRRIIVTRHGSHVCIEKKFVNLSQ